MYSSQRKRSAQENRHFNRSRPRTSLSSTLLEENIMRNFVKGIVFASFVGGMAFGSVGCGKKEANCANAVDHAVKLMMDSDEMKKASADEKKMAEAMISGMKGEMVKQCDEKLKADKAKGEKGLACVMAASKPDDLEKCDFMK